MEVLFNSNVMMFEFTYTEWPGISEFTDTICKPYNESVFKLRY